MVSKGLTFLMLLAALVSLMGKTTSDARQIRVDDRVVSGGAALPDGLERDGVMWTFKTGVGGSFAPTVIGFLSPPQTEPALTSQHRATWVWCDGPPEAVACSVRVNYFGTVLEVARVQHNLQ